MAQLPRNVNDAVRQLSGLTLSQRLAVLLGALLAAGSLMWLAQWAASPEMTPLLDMQLSAEDLARVRSGLAAIGEPHKVDNSRVLVPAAANKSALLAQLEQMDKMPADTSLGFAQMVKDANPWLPQEENTRRWTVALKTELERVLRQFNGVAKADVFLNVNGRDKSFSRTQAESKASVMLQMKGGEAVPRSLALAAARLVSGAVRGLPLKNVEVVDGSGRAALEWDSEAADSAGGLQRLQKQIEADTARKIAAQLAFDRKVRVNVQAVLDTATKTEASQTPVEGVKTEESVTETTTSRGKPGGQPGVEPNVGAVASGGSDAEVSSSTTSDARYEPGVTKTTTSSPAGSVRQIYAAINISYDYLASVFRRSNPDAKDPTEADIQAVFDRFKTKIENQVAKLVLPADPKQVAVDWYYDAPTDEAAAPSSGLDTSLELAQRYGPAGALAALAIVALALTLRMAQRRDPADHLAGDLGVPREAIEAARQAARATERGEATPRKRSGEPPPSRAPRPPTPEPAAAAVPVGQAVEGVLEAREVDDQAIQMNTMIEQLSTLIDKDEDAVAALVERWVDRGRNS